MIFLNNLLCNYLTVTAENFSSQLYLITQLIVFAIPGQPHGKKIRQQLNLWRIHTRTIAAPGVNLPSIYC